MTTAAQLAEAIAETAAANEALAAAVEAEAARGAAAATLAATAAAEALKAAVDKATEEATAAANSAAAAAAAAIAAAAADEPASNAKVDKLQAQIEKLFARVELQDTQLAAAHAQIAADAVCGPKGPKIAYLDPRVEDIHTRIESGLDTHPPFGAGFWKPQLYDLEQDAVAKRLKAKNLKNQSEEYRLLLCTTTYLSISLKALEETIGEDVRQEQPESTLVAILNTLAECESWFRKRVAFIRAKELSEDNDALFIEFLRVEIYGLLSSVNLGSAAINDITSRYRNHTQKQVFLEAAKQQGKQAVQRAEAPGGSSSGERGGGGGRGGLKSHKPHIKPLTKEGKDGKKR
jgi:hypothetical protein